MLAGETFKKVLEVLQEAEGYFVFQDEAGNEYVVARREDFFEGNHPQAREKQLPLPPLRQGSAGQATTSLSEAVRQTAKHFDTTPEFILDGINREIANTYEEERERGIDDLSVSFDKTQDKEAWRRRGKRVRFEPIHGDLPPELQE